MQDLLAPQAYLNIVQFVDRRLFRMGIVISALLVLLAIVFVLAARQYVAIKDYSSLSYSKVERRRLSPARRWLAVGFLSTADARLVHARTSASRWRRSGRGWSLTPFPLEYTLRILRAREHRDAEVHHELASSTAGWRCVICLVIGVPMAWILGRTKAPGRGSMDALTTLILAIPGTAIGIAYIRAFHFRCR